MALQGMQGVAHMAGSDHSYESSFAKNSGSAGDGRIAEDLPGAHPFQVWGAG